MRDKNKRGRVANEFEKHLRRKGLSERTIKEYLAGLNRFKQAGYRKINADSVKEWLSMPKQNNIVNRSMLKNLGELLGRDLEVPRFKARRRKIPKRIKTQELGKIKRYLKGKYPEYWLLVLCMEKMGLRVSEAVGLRAEHINVEEGTILITGKGEVQRYVYPPPKLLDLLKAFTEQRSLTSGLLFPSPHNSLVPVSTDTVRYHMRKIVPHAHPHMLRHSYASKVYNRSGGDLRAVQELLGHASIATTSVYSRISNDRARDTSLLIED